MKLRNGFRRVRRVALYGAVVSAALAATAHAQPVIFWADTDLGYDSVYNGQPISIIFYVDANGADNLSALGFPLAFWFTNGNIMGPVEEEPSTTNAEFRYSAKAKAAFENRPFNSLMGIDFVDAPFDSMTFGGLDFDGQGWYGSGEVARFVFTPTDTGTITIGEGDYAPGPHYFSALDQNANDVPSSWEDFVLSIPRQPGTPRLDVRTSYDNDELYLGGRGAIVFTLDWAGNEVTAVSFPMEFAFSNGNIIGAVQEAPSEVNGEFAFSPQTLQAFENSSTVPVYLTTATAPNDTIVFGATDFDSDGWQTGGEVARITFEPLDTGTVTIDGVIIPPAGSWDLLGPDGTLPFEWTARTFRVKPCPVVMGDVNDDGGVNSSDLIYFVNYIFKGGLEPLPRRESGDVNCTGGLTGGDVIYLVNFIFKGGDPPCACFASKI